MSNLTLSIAPHEAAKQILQKLPGRRMRDVVEKRFGLKGGRARTLQAIGGEYKITRERVRQIEADALRHLAKPEYAGELTPFFKTVEDHLGRHCGVMGESRLFEDMAPKKFHPHLSLLLKVRPSFRYASEDEKERARWALAEEDINHLGMVLERVARRVEEDHRVVSEDALYTIAGEAAREIYGRDIPRSVLVSHMAVSRIIRRNPYGEYGLVGWPEVTPSGVKDKAYAAIAKVGKPLHFRDVASHIDRAGWSKKRAHPQTVHNELIKDSRFVLVGRGLYALKEWGYEPGSVRDVMVAVCKQAASPLTKDEIISRSLVKRHVKIPTILLNLQNRSLFRRDGEGRYSLV